MASPIRPTPSSFTPSVRPNDQVSAAQRAFFQAALNGVAPAQPSAPAKSVQAAPQASQPDANEAAGGWARPGSRLDIKV